MSQEQDHNQSHQSQDYSDSQIIPQQNITRNVQSTIQIQRELNKLTCATYIFHNQDHTLGNLLRWFISRESDVQFTGYTIPHPSQSIMKLRIQTFKKDTTIVFNNGLQNIEKLCDQVEKRYLKQLNQKLKK